MEETLEQSGPGECSGKTKDYPCKGEDHPLAQYHHDNDTASGSQGSPYPDLPYPKGHGIRNYTVDPNGSENHGHQGKHRENAHDEPGSCGRSTQDRLHGKLIGHRQTWVQGPGQ